MMLALARKNEYRRHYDAWVGDALMGIFVAVGMRAISEDSRKKYLDNLDRQLSRLGDMLALVSVKTESESERKKREDNHVAGQASYAQALASLGNFDSLDQLEAAITALNETIRESRDSNGDNPGSTSLSD